MTAPGFVHYFKGPTTADGTLPVVLPVGQTGPRRARPPVGRPTSQAAALALEMYAQYDLEFHRVTKGTDGPFTFEPYDAAPGSVEPTGAGLAPGLAVS